VSAGFLPICPCWYRAAEAAGGGGVNMKQKLHLSATFRWLLRYVDNDDYCLGCEAVTLKVETTGSYVKTSISHMLIYIHFGLFTAKFLKSGKKHNFFNVALYTEDRKENESSRAIKCTKFETTRTFSQ
jgi:hypothetical protein